MKDLHENAESIQEPQNDETIRYFVRKAMWVLLTFQYNIHKQTFTSFFVSAAAASCADSLK
jgi:hypothetical protein